MFATVALSVLFRGGVYGTATDSAASDRAFALARSTGDAWIEAVALWRSGFALALAGDVARARTVAAAGVGMCVKTRDSRLRAYTLLTVGDCLTREGHPAEAITVLREALGVFEALPERWGMLRASSLLAEACAGHGDWPLAAMLLGVVDTLSDRTGGRPYAFVQAGLNQVAARGPAKLGPAWEPARQAGRALGRGDQITTALWPSAAVGSDHGNGGGLPLTHREREVAGLIAAGLTNRQIGARLFIAERTVDTHVGRILDKLGCASRSQVAALITATTATTTSPPGGTGDRAAG
jgi:DNA-binding CsgD family transcriptional regulator